MAGRPDRLELFGVVHVDRHRKVQRELAPLVADADAICLEAPEPLGFRRAVAAALRAPLCTLGAFLIELFAYLPLYLFFNQDTRPTEEVAVSKLAGDRPVYRVDRNPIEMLADAGLPIIAANWFGIVALAVIAPVQTGLTIGTIVGCLLAPGVFRRQIHQTVGLLFAAAGLFVAYWLLFAGPLQLFPVGLTAMFALVVLVHGTVDRRDDTMIDNTIDRANAGDHERVVLVTGKAHLSGMVPLARDQGVSVGRVHVSRWLRAGRTYEGALAAGSAGIDATAVSDWQAPLRSRLRAGLLDTVVILCLWTVLAVAGRTVPAVPIAWLDLLAGLVVVAVGYRGLLEATADGTLGQRVEELQVVDASGEPIGLRRSLPRSAAQLLDVAVLFVPALLSERHRLISDHLTGTHVVVKN
jgi:hypothetical protein